MRGFLSYVPALLIAAFLASGLWAWETRPVLLDEAWDKPLSSVSFAPFRRGESPLEKIYPTREEVAEDMAMVATFARGIRTYSAREGMEDVPELAARLGLEATLGAWLTSEVEEKGKIVNRVETDALIHTANAWPDAVKRVIVGNEVLLRNDLTPEKLIAYIRKVKAQIRQPVSYADVWAFYLQYPEVGREVDYLAIHILPFWEDEPVALEQAGAHIVRIVDRIREAFPGKPILIAETGWPSLGRDRGPARVSTVNQARFTRMVGRLAWEHGFDYNIVEAFDQPWKASQENTVGAAWGIWDVDRKPKFAMSGPVREIGDWFVRAAVSVVFGLAAGAVAVLSVSGFARRLFLALTAQIMAWLAVTACFHAAAVSFDEWRTVWAIFRGVIVLLMSGLIVWRVARTTGGRTEAPRPLNGEILWLFVCCYALIWAALLVFDGRYRDIPVIDFAPAAIGVVLLMLPALATAFGGGGSVVSVMAMERMYGRATLLSADRSRRLQRFLSRALPIAAVAVLVGEGAAITGTDFFFLHPAWDERILLILKATISNVETNAWALMLAVMAIPAIASTLTARRAEKQLFGR
ncbi:hypothetical protein FACS1894205_4990 [Alphaproteobacteria bacterium]|nr:hypothetical protein FACS1894205_4990 [Alphaproteobacteria bacterium]